MILPFLTVEVAGGQEHDRGRPGRGVAALRPGCERGDDRTGAGVRSAIGRGVHPQRSGGIRPRPRCVASRLLSLEDREEISRGLAAGESLRCIARRLGRAPSTISREIARNDGPRRYRALRADTAARLRSKRPKPARLAADPLLRVVVTDKLAKKWSPEQIAGWLARRYPDRPEMRVSHETIYRSLFVQSRGALRRELTRHLRSGRSVRRPLGHRGLKGKGGGKIVDAVHISQRPAEAQDRAVPGH